ncbi:MAG: alpha/beta hydrolase, partial [Myxococcales bacterium]|nr:alpha/beta hydrolase [Myxococcales bacterium]
KNADALAVDSARLAVGGDSAGGNLATVTALRCRDEGGPSLRGQLLLYPVTDHPTPEKPSYDAFAEGYGLERADMLWFWGHYLKDIQLADDPRASPLRAPDLTRLPRALVILAAFDVLRDEGEQYAERLAVAGVGVTISRYETIHGFLQLHGLHPTCARAVAEACAWLRATLGAERA